MSEEQERYEPSPGRINYGALDEAGNPTLVRVPAPSHADVWAAVAAVQAELPAIARSAEGAVPVGESKMREFKYADLAAIWAVLRPLVGRHGLALRYELVLEKDRTPEQLATLGEFTMRLWVYHPASKTGFASDFPVWPRMKGPQGLAAAATYARRYCLLHALGVVTEEEPDLDNSGDEPAPLRGRGRGPRGETFDRALESARMPDGPSAEDEKNPKISGANVQALGAMAWKRAKELADGGITKDEILKDVREHFGVEHLSDLRVQQLNTVVKYTREWQVPTEADRKF